MTARSSPSARTQAAATRTPAGRAGVARAASLERTASIRPAIVVACAIVLACGGATARADVVMPPALDCPPGAIGSTGHMGPYCAPTTCIDTGACARYGAPGLECIAAGLCVRTADAFAGRGGRVRLQVALGSCASDADCPAGVGCEVAGRCMTPGSAPHPFDPATTAGRWLPPRASGSGCASAGASALAIVLVLGSAGAFAVRRARRTSEREAAVRALLLDRGRASRRELSEIARDEGTIARALAPLALEVRVEIDDDGDVHYALERVARARRGEGAHRG